MLLLWSKVIGRVVKSAATKMGACFVAIILSNSAKIVFVRELFILGSSAGKLSAEGDDKSGNSSMSANKSKRRFCENSCTGKIHRN